MLRLQVFNQLKYIALIIIITLTMLLLYRCEEVKPQPREYPRLKTQDVSEISEAGATFNAELYSTGTELITQHGFVWKTSEVMDINVDNKILLGPIEGTGPFKAVIKSTLFPETKYYVKPFAITSDFVVYGPSVAFSSLGSSAPTIFNFKPDSAAWMDTLTINGKNFSWMESLNKVKLNDIECTTFASTDTTLSVFINTSVKDIKSKISVNLAGNVASYNSKDFTLILPRISGISPIWAAWEDTIIVTGTHLQNSIPATTGTISGFLCTIIKQKEDSVILTVPNEPFTLSNPVKLKINALTFTSPINLNLSEPIISDNLPKEGTWGNTITLTGKFNTLISRNTFFFDNVQATVISTSRNTVTIKVPESLSQIETHIIYKVTPYAISSSGTFKLKAPLIKTFSPVSGPSKSTVTVKGKYFNVGNTSVKFGSESATISSMNDSTLIVLVPAGINGPVKISVKAKLQTIISSEDYIVKNPKIMSIYPLSGTFNDEITITGENFISTTGSTTVTIGSISGTVKSLTASSIVVSVPLTMDSIPKVITVTAGSNSTSSSDKYTLSPPQIISISPESITPSQDITLNGLNFNPIPSNNYVYWDIYPLAIKSATATEIIATLPSSLPRGTKKIEINMGGYSRFSTQEFSFNSQWVRIPSPIMSTNSVGTTIYTGMTIYGESLGNFGYLCSPASNVMYRFDPLESLWTKLNVSTPFYLKVKMGEIVCKDTLYLISGFEYSGISSTMYAFHEVSNNWKTINVPFNRRTGIAFSLNNRIYFGLNYWTPYLNDLWECNPENGYLWTRKSDLPTKISYKYTSYFSLNDKGYVLLSNNNLWQYDPISDQWTIKSDFPGPARERGVSFVIGEFAYFGTGISGVINYNDIWKYNPVSDSWTLCSTIPNSRNSAVAFTLNNKAYIGYGGSSDFYEFDPNYPLK